MTVDQLKDWQIEKVLIDSDGVHEGHERTHENRGDDENYDPKLRMPIKDVVTRAKFLADLYVKNKYDYVLSEMDKGGINHINRQLLTMLWEMTGSVGFEHLYNLVNERCSAKVKILVCSTYAHRLYEKKTSSCISVMQQSIDLAKQMNVTYDKWVASGYFFAARYSNTQEDKAKYCLAALLEPRDLMHMSTHMKYWKLFRATAWLVGNDIQTSEADAAINRYLSLNFRGYTEWRGSENYTCDTFGSSGKPEDFVLNCPATCRGIMHLGKPTHIHGNP